MPRPSLDSVPHAQNQSLLSRLLRFWPLWLILALISIIGLLGLGEHLEFDQLAGRYDAIEGWRKANPVLAAVAAIGIYALVVALSIPVGWLMTLTTAVFFGWFWGTMIVLVGATFGASLLFLAARTTLFRFFRRRADPWLKRFAEGFNRDAASYLLALRITPMLPFWMMNIVPALLGVPFITFAWTTFVGILPGTLVYGVAGEGLRGLVAERAAACADNQPPCGSPFEIGQIMRTELFISLGLLALLALVPVVIRRLRPHKAD